MTRLLDYPEAASYIGRSLNALKMMVSRGTAPGVVRQGRRVQFDREAIDRWITRQARQRP